MSMQRFLFTATMFLSFAGFVIAQDDQPDQPSDTSSAKSNSQSELPSTDQLKESASKLATQTEDEVRKIAKTVDQDPNAKAVSAGILQPIYIVAESLAFPAFHWIAFALMSAGVISYALQLVLGKLVVLMKMGFSLKEIASDAVGLAISVVGLVLTTQAAAENSSFTRSPAAVISATVVGAIAGFVLYLWGQSQEIEAAAGRSVGTRAKK